MKNGHYISLRILKVDSLMLIREQHGQTFSACHRERIWPHNEQQFIFSSFYHAKKKENIFNFKFSIAAYICLDCFVTVLVSTTNAALYFKRAFSYLQSLPTPP